MAEVTLRWLPPCTRLSLRCGVPLLAPLGAAFGVPLPTAPLAGAAAGDRAALRLGPDEWLLLAEAGADLLAVLEAARAGAPASIVDISDRQHAIEASGPAAAVLLNEGCPLDLDEAAFPAGTCTRTLFGRIEILLWRPAPAHWRIEVGRSFIGSLWDHLAEVAAD